MSKWNVKLDLWLYVDNVEAETKEEAIKNALTDTLNDQYDYFTDYEKIAERILDYLNDSSTADEVDDD